MRKKIIKRCKFGKNPIVWNYVNLFDCEFGDNVMIGSFVEIRGSKVGNNCRFQPFSFLPEGIIIKNNVFISPRVTFLNDKIPPSKGKYWKKTIVEDGVVIGGSVTILPGITIGKNAFVGANSLVTKDIPKGEVWLGQPAKFYKKRINL